MHYLSLGTSRLDASTVTCDKGACWWKNDCFLMLRVSSPYQQVPQRDSRSWVLQFYFSLSFSTLLYDIIDFSRTFSILKLRFNTFTIHYIYDTFYVLISLTWPTQTRACRSFTCDHRTLTIWLRTFDTKMCNNAERNIESEDSGSIENFTIKRICDTFYFYFYFFGGTILSTSNWQGQS
jgi:hypothetical protein